MTPFLITLNVNRLEIDAFKAALAVAPALIAQLNNQCYRRTLARSHRPQQLNMG